MAVMNTWQFSTAALPRARRREAWHDAMQKLHLPIARNFSQTVGAEDFHGSVSCLTSPMGIEFGRIDSQSQTISGRAPNQAAAIWIGVLLAGKATLTETDGHQSPMSVGDVIFGPTGVEATLQFETDFQFLIIKAPRVALGPRLIAPLAPRVGYLSAKVGVNHVFSGMLRATADVLESMTSVQLRPVELALTEFLITCLAADDKPIARGGAAGARAAHLHRICQTIETMLGNPKLTLAHVATEHGVSPRYLQKLFASSGQVFSHYVRTRRLERCRADLVSPLHAQLSISEICFRWGFNGSAHFSHAFRDQYGTSPREYRRSASP